MKECFDHGNKQKEQILEDTSTPADSSLDVENIDLEDTERDSLEETEKQKSSGKPKKSLQNRQGFLPMFGPGMPPRFGGFGPGPMAARPHAHVPHNFGAAGHGRGQFGAGGLQGFGGAGSLARPAPVS